MERSPLAPCLEDIHNIDEISNWISATLKENNQAGSYGPVVGMSSKNESFPAVVFGFPNVDTAAIDSEGMGLPVTPLIQVQPQAITRRSNSEQ